VKVEEVVCLCLGHLEDNATVYQLSLLILLLERLGVHHERCSVFDPCHSSQEVDVLKHLGFTVLHENVEARIRVRRVTLFYMPHGNYYLTDNLICANYDSLHLVAILGNNLAWVCNSESRDAAAAAEAGRARSRAPYARMVLDNLAWLCPSRSRDNTAAAEASRAVSRAPYTETVLDLVKETHLQDTLASQVRSQLASLAPRLSAAFGDGLCDFMDSTLTTFPARMPLDSARVQPAPSYLQSSL